MEEANTNKKYRLSETIDKDTLLYRIIALKDFKSVRAGDVGGYVKSEANLSQEGDCWIYDEARVHGDALVYGNAHIGGNASVGDNAVVYDDATISGNALIFNTAHVCGNAVVSDNAKVYGAAEISGFAKINDNAEVHGDARVFDHAHILRNASVDGNAHICGDSKVERVCDYIVFRDFWTTGEYFTWTRSDDRWTVGSFHVMQGKFITMALNQSEVAGWECKRLVDYVEAVKKDIGTY